MVSISDKHKRVLKSTFNIIEKSIDDMMDLLNDGKKITYEISPDIDEKYRIDLLRKLNNLKKYIIDFLSYYPINKEKFSIKKILDSKKSIWAIYLEEIKSPTIQKKYSINKLPSEDYDKQLDFIINYIKSL